MNDKTLLRAVGVFYFAFLALSLAASHVAATALWGLSAWGFTSFAGGIIAALIAVFLFSRRLAPEFEQGPGRERIPQAARIIITVAVAVAALWLLRMRHDLWGERYSVAAAIDAGLSVRPGAPLAILLNRAFYRLLNPIFLIDASTVTSLVAVTAGVLSLFVLMRIARLAFPEAGDTNLRKRSAAFFLANGFAVLFFGMGGNTPVAVLFASLFIMAAILCLRGKAHPALPAALFLCAILSHLSAVYLVPGLIVMLAVVARNGVRRRTALDAIGALAVTWLIVELIILIWGGGASPTWHLVHSLAAIASGPGRLGAENLGGDLLSALNCLLITGPAGLVALLLIVSGRPGRGGNRSGGTEPGGGTGQNPDHRPDPGGGTGHDPGGRGDRRQNGDPHEGLFLTSLAIPALLLFILGGRRIDGGLRWDIAAATGPALAVYALWALKHRLTGRKQLSRAVTLLAVLGVFHGIPMIYTGIAPNAAERRLIALPLDAGRAETIIGERAFENDELERAEEWLTASTAKDSLDAGTLYYLGRIALERKKTIDAIEHISRALEIAPGDPEFRWWLAEAYIERRWYAEGAYTLEGLTADYPNDIRYWRRLGYARNYGGLFTGAIEAYERVLAMEPASDENLRSLTSAVLNRGAELQKEGDTEGAKTQYYRAVQLYPRGWRAYNNLATVALGEDKPEEALEILKVGLELAPFASKLNLNMGIALEKLGRDDEALQYLRKSIEYDPYGSGAPQYIERIEQKRLKQDENGAE